MADLSVKYLGLNLKSPIVLGSSSIASKPDVAKRAQDAGIGAFVYKSLFEEQLMLDYYQFKQEIEAYDNLHAEMSKVFPDMEHAGPEEHLVALRNFKEQVDVPVIGSLNAFDRESWIEYAGKLEQTGVDALELNFYFTPVDFDRESTEIENHQIAMLKALKERVSIPLSVKISSFYTNPLNIIKKFDCAGAKGMVLFNKFFEPDINIEEKNIFFPLNLSISQENKLSLRYAGVLFGELESDIIASSGIHTGKDVLKMMLAGANAVQMVSAFYRNKVEYTTEVLKDISDWMDKHEFNSIDEYRGMLSRKNTKNPFVYKRAQYVNILMDSEDIYNKYPKV